MRPLVLCLLLTTIAAADLLRICDRFSPHDLDGDGVAEITSLRVELPPAELDAPLLLVVVEARLLDASEHEDLRPSLATFCADLTRDGWRPALVAAELYRGPEHQDGRSLLALRRVFQEVDAHDPDFAGAVLVGSFPEALLVRSYNWRKKGRVVCRKGAPDQRVYTDVPYLRTVPEPVAMRCELVLADLDGHWEERYIQPRVRLPTLVSVFPDGVPAGGGPCEDFQRGGVVFEDLFYVNDGHFDTRELLGADGEVIGLAVEPLDAFENAECTAADKALGNPLARPDIGVSRIDASHVALRVRDDLRGVDGAGLLDDEGRPQRIELEGEAPHPFEVWEPDPALERRLLREYFARNHAWRSGAFRDAFRPAAISHDLGNGWGTVRAAHAAWAESAQPEADRGRRASLLDYVRWLKEPAALRDVRAHSDCYGSVFAKVSRGALHEACGGPVWGWSRKGNALVPQLHPSKADFPLYRSLWENGALPRGGALYLHTGCDGVSPAGARTEAYDAPGYGFWQGAECLLFYADALALLGRAKVFYDAPRGFSEVLAEGGTMGDAWRRYFELEGAAQSARQVGGGIGRKRAYFWSVVGDWTLRLVEPEDR